MKEVSRALPMHFYRNPADVIEQLQMDALGCRACLSIQHLFDKTVCMDARNKKQKGVPTIGHHCKFFKERP